MEKYRRERTAPVLESTLKFEAETALANGRLSDRKTVYEILFEYLKILPVDGKTREITVSKYGAVVLGIKPSVEPNGNNEVTAYALAISCSPVKLVDPVLVDRDGWTFVEIKLSRETFAQMAERLNENAAIDFLCRVMGVEPKQELVN